MARLLDFDPDKWGRETDAPEGSTPAKVANPAKPGQTLAALATLAGGLESTLPVGLEQLESMSPPKRCDPASWQECVTDALRLVSDGWAAQALALGWTPLDLFGVVTDPEGNPDADGLAVKLGGRRVLAICEGFATVEDEGGGRSYLHRGDTSGTRLLWELGT